MLTVGKFGQVSLKYEKWELGVRGNESLAPPPQTAARWRTLWGPSGSGLDCSASMSPSAQWAPDTEQGRCPQTAAPYRGAGIGAQGFRLPETPPCKLSFCQKPSPRGLRFPLGPEGSRQPGRETGCGWRLGTGLLSGSARPAARVQDPSPNAVGFPRVAQVDLSSQEFRSLGGFALDHVCSGQQWLTCIPETAAGLLG